MYPEVSMPHGTLSNDYFRKSDYGAALKELQLNLTMDGQGDFSAALGKAYATGGWNGLLKKEIEFYAAPGDNYDPGAVAAFYSVLGDKENAFLWLNKAYEDHALLFIKCTREFDNLRGDPRYAEMLRKMGLPE